MSTSTLSKSLKRHAVMIIVKKDFEKITKENRELRLAVKAILAGEVALRRGKTRTLASFLKPRSKHHAKNH